MITLALTWLGVALGVVAKTVGTASNTPMFLILLVFLGSGFVPTASMPAVLRQFATYQPFTAFTDTVRGLLTSGPIGDHAAVSAAWCAGIAVVGYLWAVARYSRGPAAATAQ
jgi:ABC-2 type transport system permease protein